MIDQSSRGLQFLKSMLIKVGKILLERSKKRLTTAERKARQAKIRSAWERMDSEKWYRSCGQYNLVLRLYGPFFGVEAVRDAYSTVKSNYVREMKEKAAAAAPPPVPSSNPVVGQTVQQHQHQIGFPGSHPKVTSGPLAPDALVAKTAQPHQVGGAASDSHHTTVVAPSDTSGPPKNVETEPDAKDCLIRPFKGEGLIWKEAEEKVVDPISVKEENLRLHTTVSTTQHSEGAWWSKNIVDHRIAWATLRNATRIMDMRLDSGGGNTSTCQHDQSGGGRWHLGQGAVANKLCELVSTGAQVYMRRMLNSATAAAWHREHGLARYLLSSLEYSVGGEKSCGAAKNLKRRVAIVPRISEGEISTAECLASERKEHRKKIFARDAKWRAELLNDVQVKEAKLAKSKKRSRETADENWWAQLNALMDKPHMISTVCAGLLEMQRDLALLHDVGPQARNMKRRMLTDAKGERNNFAYLETDTAVGEEETITETEQQQQQPISSLGPLSYNEDENVQRILQRAYLLLGVDRSDKNKMKLIPADIRDFLAELQPSNGRLQFSPKTLAKAMLM